MNFGGEDVNEINLVPVQYKKSLKRKWYILGSVVGGILVIILLGSLAYMPSHQMILAQKEQEDLDMKLKSELLLDLQNIIQETQVLQKEKSDIELNLEQMDIPSHISRTTIDIVVGNTPSGIRINEIIMDRLSNTADVRGRAENITNVAQYMVALYKTNQFENITYTTSQDKSSDANWQVAYNIQIQFKPFEERALKGEVDEGLEAEEVGEEEIL